MTGQPAEQPPPRRSLMGAWLQLLRAPNLLTVGGDVLVGFMIALPACSLASPHGISLRRALAVCVSLLLYSAGVVWNDLFDLAEDRRDRPSRPLPAGEIRPITAAMIANILAAASVAIAAVIGHYTLLVTMVLGLCVLAYNARAKKNAMLGPPVMGACRGLSVLVGASALGSLEVALSPVLWITVFFTTAYIAAVTFLAAGETRAKPVKGKAALILTIAVMWVLGLAFSVRHSGYGCLELAAMGACAILWTAWRLASLRGPAPAPHMVQRTVGGLIRGLILFQATSVIWVGWSGVNAAAALIGCFLLSAMLAKRFYAS